MDADVRDHLDQHEAAEELPLVTDEARVTEVEGLDEDRTDEVRNAVERILESHGREDWIDDGIVWDDLEERVAEAGLEGTVGEDLDRLRDRYERDYPSLLRVRFRVESGDLEFAPGQYVTIRFHDTPRPYSIASSPNETGAELCIRLVPDGRLTTDLFEDLDPGDEITVRGPNGDMVLQDVDDRDMVFLATGTGVAPFKSMIDYTFEEGRDVHDGTTRDIWLFHGASWRDDLAYRDRFRELADERDNFHYVPTLSREALLTDWDGETAYVQRTLMKYLEDGAAEGIELPRSLREHTDREPATDVGARIDPDAVEVYACGVSAMVETLVDAVTAIGVAEDDVEAEGFG